MSPAGLAASFSAAILVAACAFASMADSEPMPLLVAAIAAPALAIVAFWAVKAAGQQALWRRDAARLRDFAEVSSDWFWEQGADLRYTFMSKGLDERTGALASHIGKLRREVVTMGVSEEQWAAHQADLDARRPFRDFRFQRLGPDGEVRHVSISGKPFFDAAGRFKGYRGTARDVTRDVRAHQQLRRAKTEAEAASSAKGQFLAVISHELRTPLNAIIGFSEIMSREVLGPVGSVRYREYATDIFRAGTHLLGVINNILDMSKIEAGRMELSEQEVDLAALLQSCLRIVRQKAKDSSVELAELIPESLPVVRADEIRMKQIVLNLLSNALKFTPAGGTVTVAVSPAEGGTIALSIKDTGIGMSEEDIALALQPFRQVDNAMVRRQEGTGLGLPLVNALVDLHGGQLSIASEPGAGTIVTVALPPDRIVHTPSGDNVVRFAGALR